MTDVDGNTEDAARHVSVFNGPPPDDPRARHGEAEARGGRRAGCETA